MSENPADKTINPMALTVTQTAKILGVQADTVRLHIEQGLSTGPGGTINLVNYAAWLNRQLKATD